jgi:hypothetical protein
MDFVEHANVVQCIWSLKQSYSLEYKKLKLKMSKYLGVIWNCDHVLEQNAKFDKSMNLKFSYLFKNN